MESNINLVESAADEKSEGPKEKETLEKGSRSKARVKKELRNADALLKSMNSLSSEEKLQTFCLKYAEIQEENKTLQNSIKAQERRLQVLQREREQLQAENSKGILARNRLEELCRELQRQNKAVKEESLIKIREEEERRKEVAAKFQNTLSEVSTLLQQNNEKNNKLREENGEMAQRLQMLCDQYTLREQHLEKLAKQYDIERQLNEAKLAKTRMEFAEDKEKMLREKQQLLLELTEYQKKCQGLQAEEVALRQQLSMYTDKYDDFQKALAQSNRTFGGFKEQMDTMTKKLKSLEKETASWKLRWEKSNKALLDMATEKQQRDQLLTGATKQVAQLEKLCRALQAERTALIAQLKEKAQPEPTVAESQTVEMAAETASLSEGTSEAPPISQQHENPTSDQPNQSAEEASQPVPTPESPNSRQEAGQEDSPTPVLATEVNQLATDLGQLVTEDGAASSPAKASENDESALETSADASPSVPPEDHDESSQ